jgi:predicted acyltransferase
MLRLGEKSPTCPKTTFNLRYLSIDFYRGMTIAFMIIVNTPGTWEHVFGPLRHANWHGCTPTDLVFPSFLFIIGTSMWFSFQKYGQELNADSVRKILKRAGLLVLIGLLLNKYPLFWMNWDTWRFMGVMQRLGLCYGIAALLALWLPARTLAITAGAMLLWYWAILYFGVQAGQDPYGLEHNAVRMVDLAVFGPNHLWKGRGIPFDPEGILSTIPAAVTVLIGWWSGALMQRHKAEKMKAVYSIAGWGAALTLLGLVWHLVFPINKLIWTSSYVSYCGGISMILLAFSIWVIDIVQWTRGVQFFIIFGSNPLIAYVLSGILAKSLLNIKWVEDDHLVNGYGWLYKTVFKVIEPYSFGSLLFALSFMLTCWLVCFWMYKRKIFVKL